MSRSVLSRVRPWQTGLAILAIGVGGYALLVGLRPDPPRQEPPRLVPVVTTVDAEGRSGFLTVRGNGTVRPSAEVSLAPEVSGRVVGVSATMVSGGRFRAGDELFRIDPTDYENAVEIARAEVAAAQVEVLQAEEQVELAREEYARLRAREQIDMEPDSTEFGSLLFREPQLEAARAALRRAEARLGDANLALRRTRVRAPFDGIVRTEEVDRGQFVSPGQPVAVIYATELAEVVVALSDEEAALIPDLWNARAGRAGAEIPATIYADFGGTTWRWEGYVDRAESALDERTRTVDVVVRVPAPFDPQGAQSASDSTAETLETTADERRPPLLIGAYTAVDIQGRELERFVSLPRAALRDGPAIWTVRDDTLLVIQPVELLQEVEDEIHLLAEIADGTPVVITPLSIVTDSMTVRLAREPSEIAGGVSP